MSIYTRRYSSGKPIWWINVQWKDYDRIHISTRTSNKSAARALLATLRQLKAAGRRDLLGLIATKRLGLHDVHAALHRDPQAIMHLWVESPSPSLGVLVDEWLGWLRGPAGIGPRTNRRYGAQTIRRYEVSWSRMFSALPRARETLLSELTSGALAEYRKLRVANGCTGQTVNRDICAVQSFMRWAREEQGLEFAAPAFRKVKELTGRERWLTAAEIEAVRFATPEHWWPLFAMLIYTGMRIGEAQGLRWADVQFVDGKISIHTRYRALKSPTSDRDVPIPAPLATLLAGHALRVPNEVTDPVFPDGLGSYWKARRVWLRILKAAGVVDCRIHDLRHTFGVHAARAGVPIARLQYLLGHAHPHMTMRYMRHAPDSDFAKDASLIAESMAPPSGPEADAKAALRRSRFGIA